MVYRDTKISVNNFNVENARLVPPHDQTKKNIIAALAYGEHTDDTRIIMSLRGKSAFGLGYFDGDTKKYKWNVDINKPEEIPNNVETLQMSLDLTAARHPNDPLHDSALRVYNVFKKYQEWLFDEMLNKLSNAELLDKQTIKENKNDKEMMKRLRRSTFSKLWTPLLRGSLQEYDDDGNEDNYYTKEVNGVEEKREKMITLMTKIYVNRERAPTDPITTNKSTVWEYEELQTNEDGDPLPAKKRGRTTFDKVCKIGTDAVYFIEMGTIYKYGGKYGQTLILKGGIVDPSKQIASGGGSASLDDVDTSEFF